MSVHRLGNVAHMALLWHRGSRNLGDMAVANTLKPEYDRGFNTRAIHAGQEPDLATGAVVPAIYQVSTYKQDGVGGLRGGYEYSRSANPTRTALEECLAALEGGGRGFAFASGLAGQDTVIRALLRPGDHVVVPTDAYGGTYRLLNKVALPWGVEHTIARISDVEAVRAAVRPGQTKIVWVETPTNPLLGIADIAALADVAHEAGAILAVDNTFATPYLQQPLALGADVVMHSTTKYCGGHSDVVGGAVVTAKIIAVAGLQDAQERIAFHQNSMGAIAGPFDAWLVLRGLKTLGVRMDRHCDNAEMVVEFLQGHAAVTAVHYPGLSSHPGHEVATQQMKRYGGMVSFQVTGGEQQAVDVCGATQIWTLGESLGGVESLIEHPARMTHASVRGTELEVPADLVRLSTGIEDAEDLIDDLDRALTKSAG
jgi:cystathionine gamma-synthase